MKVLLLNVPHESIGSRIPVEHLPPLGLLCIGGPLLDTGHEVTLLDAEFGPMSQNDIIKRLTEIKPDALLMGHSGSTSAHPVSMAISRRWRQLDRNCFIIYGGVFPTYHWKQILENEPQIDFIVRGEGEKISLELISALAEGRSLVGVSGISYRESGTVKSNSEAPVIENMDQYRIGWELIDFKKYTYWGQKRAVVVQFSRGCTHNCSYCGQSRFWKEWRHRDPQQFAKELAWLHREYGVEVINFADENPTSDREVWLQFINALIAEKVSLILVGSTRADDIVRDADILHLYKKAGVARWLLGFENTSSKTLNELQKGSSNKKNRAAIGLLRKHSIISMVTFVADFAEETHLSYLKSLKSLLHYDPDQIQSLYATPHQWTPFYKTASHRLVINSDLRRWDYKHQVLNSANLSPFWVLFWVKLIEGVMQLRLSSLKRVLGHKEIDFRKAMRWYYQIGRKVWFLEIYNFFFRRSITRKRTTLLRFWSTIFNGH